MGLVVTTNSATLVNKGLEVIEAHLLFGIPFEEAHDAAYDVDATAKCFFELVRIGVTILEAVPDPSVVRYEPPQLEAVFM
jgi:hypothetical protein